MKLKHTDTIMNKEYNYVIARKSEDCDRLSVYTHFTEVHYGTKQDAYATAKLISVMAGKEYKPYFINVFD